jgi:hypothetical protein
MSEKQHPKKGTKQSDKPITKRENPKEKKGIAGIPDVDFKKLLGCG